MLQTQFKSRLCFVTDAEAVSHLSLVQQVDAAATACAGLVQYRSGDKPTREMVDEATHLVWRCRKSHTPLVVCGRVDVALAATAEGVHLGPGDMPPALARRMMGPHAIIGVTIRNLADAREAQRQGASYVAIGPIFPTPDMPGMALGPRALEELGAAVSIPVCAMGGITFDNVMQLCHTCATLIAVNAGLASARDAQRAAQSLARRLQLA